MSDPDDVPSAVSEFLDEADTVYGEYDQGYMDADAALARLRTEIEQLRRTAEE